MTALEKFNEINGLQKLEDQYATEFKVEEQSESVILIFDEYNIEFRDPITFECYYDEPPFITIYWNYHSRDIFDGRVGRINAQEMAYNLARLEDILGLED